MRAWDRVDLGQGASRVFLVEHAAAACALFGVLAAEVHSLIERFDPSRPSHAAAAAAGYLPTDTFGSADGRIWKQVGDWPLRQAGSIRMCSIADTVTLDTHVEGPDASRYMTRITLAPPSAATIDVRCAVNGHCVVVRYDPAIGVLDRHLRDDIAAARSIAVKPEYRWDEEAIMHALGDVIGDIVGIGHVLANLDVELGYCYHAATHSVRNRLLSGDLRALDVSAPD